MFVIRKGRLMVKKIAYLVVICMLFAAVGALASCVERKGTDESTSESTLASNSDTDNNNPDNSNAGNGNNENSNNNNGNSSESEKVKSIDLYIIAGQSNATGHTKFDKTLLASLWSDYAVGSSNVLYRGTAEYTLNVNTENVSTDANEVFVWTNAKAGQGKTTAHMGAEVGMAAKLSSTYYTGDKVCGIIKYAHGGTSIFNSLSGENLANGNWASPSYADLIGVEYNGLTGNLYRNLLTEVRTSITQLQRSGYTEINLKGMFWMQGETDVRKPDSYAVAIEYFINDIRKDLGEIMGEDLSKLPIMIGEISRTFGSASESDINRNETFIEMQRNVAEDMDNVYIISSGKYEVTWLENGESVNGQDPYHWTTEPMFRIGELVAECILDNILKVNK